MGWVVRRSNGELRRKVGKNRSSWDGREPSGFFAALRMTAETYGGTNRGEGKTRQRGVRGEGGKADFSAALLTIRP